MVVIKGEPGSYDMQLNLDPPLEGRDNYPMTTCAQAGAACVISCLFLSYWRVRERLIATLLIRKEKLRHRADN